MSADDDQRIVAAVQRTEVLAHQGRESVALELISEALAADPDHPMLHARRAWLLMRVERTEAALDAARTALHLDPAHEEGLLQLSSAHLHRQEYAEAEETLSRMLELWPEDALYHRQLALAVAIPYEDRSLRRTMKKPEREARNSRARRHAETALELASEDPAGYDVAARVLLIFGENGERALRLVEDGLALAPEDVNLLQLRSIATDRVLRAKNERGSKRDADLVAAEGADRVLRVDAGNPETRRRLFELVRAYRGALVDVPLIALPLIAFDLCHSFTEKGVIVFFPGTIIAAVYAVVRLLRYRRLVAKVNPAFLRSIVRGSRTAKASTVLSAAAAILAAVIGASLPFMRDAVVVRWTIVALGVGIVIALTASVLWQVSYAATSRASGGGTDTVGGVSELIRRRRQLFLGVAGRTVVAAIVAAIFMGSGRSDALAIFHASLVSLLIPPVLGLILTGVLEVRRVRSLPSDSHVRLSYDGPRRWRFAVAGTLAFVAAAAFVGNLSALPVVPNEYDAIVRYPLLSETQDSDPRESVIDLEPVVPTFEPLELPTIEVPEVVVPGDPVITTPTP